MNFLLISGRLPSHLQRLTANLNLPKHESLVTVVYSDCRSAGVTKTAQIYLNRPEDSIAPIFPSDPGYFEGCITSDAIKVSEHEMVIVTVLASNQEDAELLAVHATSFIFELSNQ